MKTRGKKTDKRAIEKVMSIWLFVIIFLVTAAVVYMVAIFYGKPFEIRNIETGLLTDKVADCVSYAGYLRDGVLTPDFQNNFLKTCGITFNVEDEFGWKNQGQYYLQVDIYNFGASSNSTPLLEADAGNPNLKSFCGLSGNGLPYCLERDLYAISKDGEQYTVKINAIIGKAEKNE